MCHYAPYNGNEVYVLVTFIWNTDIAGADLGFLKGGLFFGKALVLEARGSRGTCPPDFLKRGHRGAPC